MIRNFEVVVVGAGPAGMSAAVELARLGVKTAIVDEHPEPGGQIYRQPSTCFTITDPRFLHAKSQNGRKLIESFHSVRGRLSVFSEAYVWGVFDRSKLALKQKDKIILITYDKLLLTEGAMERSIPFPGWTLPGVMMLGGLQKLVFHERLLPGRNFLLAGSSPLLLPVAANIIKAGGKVVALCDANRLKGYRKLIPAMMRQKGLASESASYYFSVIRNLVPTLRPYTVVRATGDKRVEEATVAKLDEDWRPIPGSEKSFQIDVVGLSYGFLSSARLTRLCGCAHVYDPTQAYWKPKIDAFMQSSLADIYVAGDSAGIGGADMAKLEGRIAASHIAAELGRLSTSERDDRLARLFKSRARIDRYVSALNNIFVPRSGLYSIIDEETIVCRCEQIKAGEVFAGIELGYRNINEIKRTRVGMGLCQGRTCESIVTQLMIQRGLPIEEIGHMSLRPPLSPMPFSLFKGVAESVISDKTVEALMAA